MPAGSGTTTAYVRRRHSQAKVSRRKPGYSKSRLIFHQGPSSPGLPPTIDSSAIPVLTQQHFVAEHCRARSTDPLQVNPAGTDGLERQRYTPGQQRTCDTVEESKPRHDKTPSYARNQPRAKSRTDLCALLVPTLLLSSAHHLAKLVLFGELAGENAQIPDQFMAGCDHRILGCDFTVGLHPEQELGHQRVRNLDVAGE